VLAPNAKLRPAIIPNTSTDANANAAAPDQSETLPRFHLGRMSWAGLLKRVFDIDIEKCPHCGGTLRIIAALLDPTVIAKILTHLGWSARAPPRSPARHFALLQTA
jgi:hypothetical protein